MAQSGPFLNHPETDGLVEFFRLLLAAGQAARDPRVLDLSPRERWDQFPLRETAKQLSRETLGIFSRYSWHRMSEHLTFGPDVKQIGQLLAQSGHALSHAQMQMALIAGSFWSEPDDHSALQNVKALAAIEEFSALVNGFQQSLPLRLGPDEAADVANRYFRAYQRRRYGPDVSVRAPQMLIKRLPMAAQHIIDTYADQLIYGSPSSARAFATTAAVALGRPLDETIIAQLEVALSCAILWRNMPQLPVSNSHHPLFGEQTIENEHEWTPTSKAIIDALSRLSTRAKDSSDSAFVQTPAHISVADVKLDGKSLSALQRLDEYIHSFAVWIRHGPGHQLPADKRIAAFDRVWRGTDVGVVTSGARIVGSLPPGSVKVIANFDALIARGNSGEVIATELASALGDHEWASRMKRSLKVASAWLDGQLSSLEKAKAPEVVLTTEEQPSPELEALRHAKQRDAESLLDFGASIAELVRFSRNLDRSGQTPRGWWRSFHEQSLGNIPTPADLLDRLPEGSRELLHHYAKTLESQQQSGDITSAPRALAVALGRLSEEHCVRTLAVALSVGVVWSDFNGLAKDAITDTLLGAEPTNPRDQYITGRAQAQLQWGLQELLRVDAIVGV